MRILISGGTGYVGSFLCHKLVESGYEIAVLTQQTKHLENTKTCTYSGNIAELKVIFEEWQPTHIIHLAADVSKSVKSENLDKMLAANIILPAYLLQLAEEYSIQKFINISTFSTSVDGNTYSPQTYYAATKKATEDLVAFYSLRTNLSVITLCFYDIYGPNQHHARFLNDVITAIKSKKELNMSPGEQEICFLNVHDAVNSMIHALNLTLESNQIHTYCVYGTEVFQLKTVPQRVADVLGLECPIIAHSFPYRKVEIIKFAPPYPLLKDWNAKISFAKGIKEIMTSTEF